MTSQALSGASGRLPGLSSDSEATQRQAWTRPDGRRTLQLALATIWLLDGVLQLQSFFFTKSFGLQMISGMSLGNPSVVARPITWSATAIGHHAVITDACFALAQIAIAVAIAWRTDCEDRSGRVRSHGPSACGGLARDWAASSTAPLTP